MTDLNKCLSDFDAITVSLPNIHHLQELKEVIIEDGEFSEEKEICLTMVDLIDI